MDLLDRLLGHDAWTTRQLLLLCRGLTDEQLDRQAPVTDGRPALTARGVLERILIGHALGHGASIRAATGRESRTASSG